MAFLTPRWYWKMRSGYVWKHFQMWANVPCWFAPCDTSEHLGRDNNCLVWAYNYERNWLINRYVNLHVSQNVKCCMNRSLQDDQGCVNIQLISKYFKVSSLFRTLSCTLEITGMISLNIFFLKKIFIHSNTSLFISSYLKK